MKQIIFILALFLSILPACSNPESVDERDLLKERIRMSDSLAAEALLDSIKAARLERLADSARQDTVRP
ncbi:MAG: hypothetical protein R3B47_07295 [Bacteroidia bacterium]